MPDCEMCGKETDELVDAIVEGSMMNVCLDCSRHGSVIPVNEAVVDKKVERKKDLEVVDYVDIITDDYAKLIKKAREKMGLTQEDLAKKIAERESIVHQVESGNLKPSFKLAKKLSVFLNVDLVETVKQERKAKKEIDYRDRSVTVGDLLKGKG